MNAILSVGQSDEVSMPAYMISAVCLDVNSLQQFRRAIRCFPEHHIVGDLMFLRFEEEMWKAL